MHQVWHRRLAVANLSLLVVGLLTIGQVRYDDDAGRSRSGLSAGGAPGLTAPKAVLGSPSPSDTDSPSAAAEDSSSTPPSPSADGTTDASTAPTTLGPLPTTPTGAAHASAKATKATKSSTKPTSAPTTGHQAVPDLGLITQGVTDKTVLIGVDYNKSGCGGIGALSQQFSQAAVGDPEKSLSAYVSWINDTGGIGGRKLSYVSVDDGGETCPDQHAAAATALVDDDKVFMDLGGLHQVTDLLAARHLPFYGGESSLAQENSQGYGQFQLLQDADSDFTSWASFGKNYIASDKNTPCFIYPDEDDFPALRKILDAKMAAQGLRFKDEIAYQDDVSTAASQAQTYAVQMKADGCKQVWTLANNALALVFFTGAANGQSWYPTWTWTSRTAGVDTALFGSLMNANEWKSSIGLTSRVQSGVVKQQGDCAAIYKKYYPSDGESGSANAQLYCPQVLLAAEAMRRGIDKTGVLTGNSLMVGVDAIKGDFFYDATVPLTFSITKDGQSDFTAFDESTVGKWDPSAGDISFPEFPAYWKVMGPGKSGGIDLRTQLGKTYTYVNPKQYSYSVPTG